MSDEYYLVSEEAKRFVHIGWINMAGIRINENSGTQFLKEAMGNGWHDTKLVYDQNIYNIFDKFKEPFLELRVDNENPDIWTDEMWKTHVNDY